MADGSVVIGSRFRALSGWQSFSVSVLSGVAVALGHVPYSWSLLGFAGLCLALALGIASENSKQAFWRGWAHGFGAGLLGFFWITSPFLVDVETHGWMAPFALVLMAAGLGCFCGAAFALARKFFAQHLSGFAIAFPVLYALSEVVRSYAFTGFPWNLTAYIWIETPIYQLASLFGPHGLTLITLLTASSIVAAIMLRSILTYVLAATLAISVGVLPYFALTAEGVEPSNDRPMLRLVQPNAAQHEKWDPEKIPLFFERQLELSQSETGAEPDLIIWPEVAVAFLLNDAAAPFSRMTAAAGNTPLVFGAQRLDGRRAFNSLAYLADGEISEIYDKHHLVPFGEYVPGAAILSRVGLKAMTAKYGFGYSAGPGLRTLDFGKLGRVLPLICYEAIFPHEMRRVEARPDWMLIITNDAWFGEASGPYQHLAQAKARAIEFALPMVRVANTGVSAVFDATGRLTASLPLGASGKLEVRLPAARPASLYWKTGDTPAVFAMIVLLIIASMRRSHNPIDRFDTGL